ncbi:MAG: hypothetical protein ACRBFS_03510 [Aureispira sp.]
MKCFFFAALVALLFTACTNETPKEQPKLSKEDQALVDNIKKLSPLRMEPQVVFDQSQLTNNALGLCAKFKSLNNFDRKDVFEKLDPLLPNCPTEMGEKNETTANFDEGVQLMTYNDLQELLGEPNEVSPDGKVAYYLAGDESYKVIFLPNAQGTMACRYYEANS